MKKLLVCILFLLISSLCFAQQKKSTELEVFTGIPVFIDRLDYENFFPDTVPLSFGIKGIFPFSNTNFFKWTFGFNYYIPGTFLHEINNDTVFFEQNKGFWELQLGMTKSAFEKGKFKVPVTSGFHFYYLSANSYPEKTVSWEYLKTGFGLNMSMAAQLYIIKTLYFLAGYQGIIDVLTNTSVKKYDGIKIRGKDAYFIDKDSDLKFGGISINFIVGLGIKLGGSSK